MGIFIQDKIVAVSKHGNGRQFTYDIRYTETSTKKPVLVFVHGFKGFKDWGVFNLMANELASQGYVVVKCNLSHNGTTPDQPIDFSDLEAFGQNNFTIELDDLGVILDSVLSLTQVWNKEIDTDKLGLIGHSRGGSLVLLKTGEDARVKAVVSLAAVADLAKYYSEEALEQWQKHGVLYVENGRTGQRMPMYYQFAEDFQANRERFSIEKSVSNLDKPGLFIHGTADTSVGIQDLHQLQQWQPQAEVLQIDEANHTFGATHPWPYNNLPIHFKQVVDKMADFFDRQFK